MKFWRDILIVARHELSDSIRSRRALIVLILYIGGGLLVSNGIVSSLGRAEVEISKALGLPPSAETGTVIDNLWKSQTFRRMMDKMLGDSDLAGQLVSFHPMAILYGLLAFTFTPVLVILLSSPRISEEIDSGSVRFALIRTSRWSWCLGKFAGQALMMVAALTLSAVCVWCLLRFRIMGMSDLDVARGMIILSWKAWVYSLAYLGLALGISHMVKSGNKATALAFAGWILIAVLGALANRYGEDGGSLIWGGIKMSIPSGHRIGLWRTDALHLVPSAVFLVTLAMVYLSAGHAFLARKDL